MTKNKVSYENKIQAVKEYIKGGLSQKEIARKFDVSATSFQVWLRKYESEGAEALKERKSNKKYSAELKLQAVNEYFAGKGSQEEICKKYKISSKTQLQKWIMWYNGHKELKKRSTAKGEIYMTKGRKTTQEERVEIVAFCIEHGKDYALTVEKYKVSYQQVYSWVRKY